MLTLYPQVFFFVPSTNQAATLEDMSYVFGRKMRDHARAQWRRLIPGSSVKAPLIQWKTAYSDRASVSTVNVGPRGYPSVPLEGETPPNDVRIPAEGSQARRKVIRTSTVDESKGEDPDTITSCEP